MGVHACVCPVAYHVQTFIITTHSYNIIIYVSTKLSATPNNLFTCARVYLPRDACMHIVIETIATDHDMVRISCEHLERQCTPVLYRRIHIDTSIICKNQIMHFINLSYYHLCHIETVVYLIIVGLRNIVSFALFLHFLVSHSSVLSVM